MNRLKSKLHVFLLILGIVLAGSIAADALFSDRASSSIELSAWADRLEIGSDQDLVFTIQAVWEGELDRFEIAPVRPPECKLLEISGSSSVNETKMIEGKTKTFKTFNFFLKPVEQGQGEVGSVEFIYLDPVIHDTSSLFTQSIVVQIGPPVKKEDGDAVIYLVLILLVLFSSLTYLVIRKREKETREQKIKTEEKVEMSLEQDTSEKLSELEPLLIGEEMEQFFAQIYRLITRYVQRKYHIITTGKTTSEIIASLSHLSIGEERIRLLETILKRCDVVKFAKGKMEKAEGQKVLEDFQTILEQS